MASAADAVTAMAEFSYGSETGVKRLGLPVTGRQWAGDRVLGCIRLAARLGSDRIGSDRIRSDRIGSDRIGSDPIVGSGSDRLRSARATQFEAA